MSRESLPPVPPTLGVPADYNDATFARVWPERRVTYVAPTLPPPIQRAVEISDGDATASLPLNARSLAALGRAAGCAVRITRAVGYDMNGDGSQATRDVMEPTGKMTPGGKKRGPVPETRKVGEELLPPAESIRVVVRTADDKRFVGHWKNNAWDFGLILDGRTLVRNCNWSELKEALNAESREDLRNTQLPLEGNDGKPL